jgi:MFS family permease
MSTIENSLKTILSRYRHHSGWLVVAVGFILLLLMFGTRISFGVYIKPMAESFGATRASISGSQSLYMIVYAVFALIAGSLSDRYGPRRILVVGAMFMGVGMLLASRVTSVHQYYLSYGVLVAMGSGGTYVPVAGAVSKFFTRRRNLAIGITAAGGGLGQFLIPPFMEKVVKTQGWQTAFLYTALLLLVIGISLPLLLLKGRGLPEDYEVEDQGDITERVQAVSSQASDGFWDQGPEKHYTLRQAMGTVPFWTYFGMYFILCFVIDGVLFVHIYPYLTDMGFGGQTAAKALGYLGLINTVTMIAFAPLGDRVNKRVLLTGLFAIHTLFLFWFIHIKTESILWLFILCYGILLGASWPLTVSLLPDIFGSRSVSSILGACTLGFGMAGLIAPWMAGHIYDLYNSYIPVFYFIMALSFLSVVFTYFTRKTRGMV